jgi:hypothetical protein
MMSWNDVPKANPSGHCGLPSGARLMGFGENMPAGVNEVAVLSNKTPSGELSHAEIRTPSIPRVSTTTAWTAPLRSLVGLFTWHLALKVAPCTRNPNAIAPPVCFANGVSSRNTIEGAKKAGSATKEAGKTTVDPTNDAAKATEKGTKKVAGETKDAEWCRRHHLAAHALRPQLPL